MLFRSGDGMSIKKEIDSRLSRIRDYLVTIQKDVEAHNQQLRGHIRQCATDRRERLGKHTEIAKIMNIPLKKNPGAPDLSTLPIKRKLIRPLPPTPSTPPEPGIRDEDYAHILSVISHEGRSFEATPHTFAKHDEEELRDIILAHLNGHYEGNASGETFRGSGKTDIKIEMDNRAAFVGECKVWRGQKQFGDALVQLLSYLTWRDCKSSLVVFNKDVAGFTGIQKALSETLEAHSNCVKSIPCGESGEWRFLFRSTHDSVRHIAVHVFLFNLYVSSRVKKGNTLRA